MDIVKNKIGRALRLVRDPYALGPDVPLQAERFRVSHFREASLRTIPDKCCTCASESGISSIHDEAGASVTTAARHAWKRRLLIRE